MAKKHSVINELDERIEEIRKQSGEGNGSEDEELDAEEELEDDDESSDEDGKDSSRKSKTDDDEEEDDSDGKPDKKGKKKEEDESEADDEDDEEDSDEDDDDDSDEDEDDDEDDDDSAPGRITPKQYKNLRSQKRASDASAKALLDLIGATSLDDAKTKLEVMKSTAAPSTEFLDAAKELGIEDPENVQKLFGLFKTTIEKDVVEGKVKPLQTQLADIMDAVAPILSANALEKEWQEFAPSIEEMFPQATRSQLKEARKLMSDLAETEKYTDSKMDFILFKEAPQFEDIFGPAKRKTMLPARSRPDTRVDKKSKSGLPDIDPTDHNSIIKARKEMKRIQSGGDDLREDSNMEI